MGAVGRRTALGVAGGGVAGGGAAGGGAAGRIGGGEYDRVTDAAGGGIGAELATGAAGGGAGCAGAGGVAGGNESSEMMRRMEARISSIDASGVPRGSLMPSPIP